MPSFDVVSEVNLHEVSNAVDQANREVTNRFDFEGSGAQFERDGSDITLTAQNEFQLGQMMDILEKKLVKRSVDIACMDVNEPDISLNAAKQKVRIKQGIDADTAIAMVKAIKASKIKVQVAIQGEELRVSGKKRDDLQGVIQFLKGQDYGIPLQFVNMRD